MSWVFRLRRRFHIIRREIRRGIREVPYIWLASRYRIGPEDYRRIYFYHVRKAAGTSLNHAMLSLGGEDGQDVYRRMHESYRLISGDKIFVGWRQGVYRGRALSTPSRTSPCTGWRCRPHVHIHLPARPGRARGVATTRCW